MGTQISIVAGKLFFDDVPSGASISKNEAAVLSAIFSRRDGASKDFIMTALYGVGRGPEIKIVDVVVHNIRKKFDMHRRAIQTVWGRGYAGHRDYFLIPSDPSVAVQVNAELLTEAAKAAGQDPADLVERLLTDECRRLRSEAA